MNVFGHEITTTDQVICWYGLPTEFRAHQVQALLAGRGVPDEDRFRSAAYRGADRLIQKWRKAGRVRLDGRVWHKTDAALTDGGHQERTAR